MMKFHGFEIDLNALGAALASLAAVLTAARGVVGMRKRKKGKRDEAAN